MTGGRLRKLHWHSEQFDGHLHAACGAGDLTPSEGENVIVGDDRFEAASSAVRCRRCAALYWPRGGEPLG